MYAYNALVLWLTSIHTLFCSMTNQSNAVRIFNTVIYICWLDPNCLDVCVCQSFIALFTDRACTYNVNTIYALNKTKTEKNAA